MAEVMREEALKALRASLEAVIGARELAPLIDIVIEAEGQRIATLPEQERTWIEEKSNYWRYRISIMEIDIAPRPYYCDRGRWKVETRGIPDIDGADGFPRYFMDLERAKLEMADWLDWKIKRMKDEF